MKNIVRIPINITKQKEGGWLVTSPLISELITEIDDINELQSILKDALKAVIELYEDLGKEFPSNIIETVSGEIETETLIEV